MHLPDGVLPNSVLIAGWGIAAGGSTIALRRHDESKLPELGVMTSLFFVVTLVHLPVSIVDIHLQLAALVGIVLGPLCVPSLLVALLLQALLLRHGGIVSLGANTTVQASGAFVAWLVFRGSLLRNTSAGRPLSAASLGWRAALATAACYIVSSLLLFLIFLSCGEAFEGAARIVLASSAVLGLIEMPIVAAAVVFLARVRPSMVLARYGGDR